jgi:dihydropteroate synthase/2-amino-4-hydroxy-6-hydroxymethyldihydropteridine diphosphokinase
VANLVYLSLGTNLGSRHENLQFAIDALGEVAAIEAISPVYETAPWGLTDQPEFLNICLKVRTLLEPASFLANCQEIERKMGRVPSRKWGPRLIDIDLIYFNDWILEDDELVLPHRQIEQRAFVLAPLADIDIDLVDPRTGKSVSEMLEKVDASSVNLLESSRWRLKRPSMLAWGVKTYVMGILNATPDSFSGDGLYQEKDAISRIVEKGKQYVRAGADMLDIGGESTRPGGKPISEPEELRRVVPAVEALASSVDVPISVDTYRASVARAGLEAGARWINDVWAMRMDTEMAPVIASAQCPIILMHNRSKPKDTSQEERLGGRYIGVRYDNLIEDIRAELDEAANLAIKAGIQKGHIVLDPGIGFGKTVTQNLRIIDELDRFVELGFPILVGPSRKSFIGYTLNLPPDQRVEGTAAAIAIAIDRGADIVRVHDVEAMVRVAKMSDHIVRS